MNDEYYLSLIIQPAADDDSNFLKNDPYFVSNGYKKDLTSLLMQSATNQGILIDEQVTAETDKEKIQRTKTHKSTGARKVTVGVLMHSNPQTGRREQRKDAEAVRGAPYGARREQDKIKKIGLVGGEEKLPSEVNAFQIRYTRA